MNFPRFDTPKATEYIAPLESVRRIFLKDKVLSDADVQEIKGFAGGREMENFAPEDKGVFIEMILEQANSRIQRGNILEANRMGGLLVWADVLSSLSEDARNLIPSNKDIEAHEKFPESGPRVAGSMARVMFHLMKDEDIFSSDGKTPVRLQTKEGEEYFQHSSTGVYFQHSVPFDCGDELSLRVPGYQDFAKHIQEYGAIHSGGWRSPEQTDTYLNEVAPEVGREHAIIRFGKRNDHSMDPMTGGSLPEWKEEKISVNWFYGDEMRRYIEAHANDMRAKGIAVPEVSEPYRGLTDVSVTYPDERTEVRSSRVFLDQMTDAEFRQVLETHQALKHAIWGYEVRLLRSGGLPKDFYPMFLREPRSGLLGETRPIHEVVADMNLPLLEQDKKDWQEMFAGFDAVPEADNIAKNAAQIIRNLPPRVIGKDPRY